MPHLLNVINTKCSIEEVYQLMATGHDFLCEQVHASLKNLSEYEANKAWGIHLKRLQVEFPETKLPQSIDPQLRRHNLIEVINQAATVARLLDALAWARENLRDYEVVLCHPTTSSEKTNERDNDLILINKRGQLACFEVSDVVSRKDSNGKEKKDLASLRVLEKGEKRNTYRLSEQWLAGENSNERLFLVVSPELAEGLRTRKKTPYCYQEYPTGGSSSIFEVLHRV